ncbi:UNVERIFIED_CONTAM: hypothetical protein K2H54_013025, partial [Gekko kuhli]
MAGHPCPDSSSPTGEWGEKSRGSAGGALRRRRKRTPDAGSARRSALAEGGPEALLC